MYMQHELDWNHQMHRTAWARLVSKDLLNANDDWLQSLLEYANEKHKDSAIVEVSYHFIISLPLKSSLYLEFGMVVATAAVRRRTIALALDTWSTRPAKLGTKEENPAQDH